MNTMMLAISFLNPWVAGGLAAVVLPALIILYFLKLRRREERVPSTFLWRRAVQDLQVNAPFQKLRRNLLLFLQLAVLILALLALARPIVQTELAQEKSVVMLIDRSASMNTRETGGKTRFEDAREQAARYARTLNRTGGNWLSFFGFGGATARTRVMVIAFAERASVVCPFTTNASDAASLIETIEPSDGQTNLSDAIKLAQAYMMPGRGNVETGADAAPQPPADGGGTPGSSAGVPLLQNPTNPESASRLVLFSDGAVESIEDVTLLGGNVTLIRSAEQRDNAGITAFRLQRNYEKPEMLDVFVQVQNFGPDEITTDVTLYVDGQFSQSRVESVTLGPARGDTATQPAASGEQRHPAASSLSFQFPLERAGLLEARLARDDALPVDNRAYAFVPPPRKMSVLLVSEENKFLEFVLNGLPLQSWTFRTPQQYEAEPVEKIEIEGHSVYDAVIFDKYAPKRFPSGNYILFGVAPPVLDSKTGDAVEDFALMWWDETHPLLRHVALDYVLIAKGVKLELPRGAQTIAEGPHGPVISRVTGDGRNCVVVGFPVEASTWWMKPSFPVFVYNAMRFLGDAELLSDQEPTRPGDPLRIPLPAGVERAVVHRPDNSKADIIADASQIARFAGTREVGIYRAEPGVEGRDRFAVNLLDPPESNIAPRDFKVGGQAVEVGDKIRMQTPEIWRWFVGAALAFVLIEWYIYNRRVML
ncbi:MAG: BatA domain-containing protein [Planctomycetes bacterium]|nr:BatA domain-containing protein [Planctomycetota bacterium]